MGDLSVVFVLLTGVEWCHFSSLFCSFACPCTLDLLFICHEFVRPVDARELDIHYSFCQHDYTKWDKHPDKHLPLVLLLEQDSG